MQTNTYDNADRLTNPGYTYDPFGRITTVPAADTGAPGNITTTYYANDLVRSITQNGSTQTFDLDPQLRVSVKAKTGTGASTETYAYTDDSDSPAWTETTAGSQTTWTRTVDGIGAAEAVQSSTGGAKLMLQNLRGDVVAQSSAGGTLSSFSKVDEFGVPKAAPPGGVKYAFHGSKQREALTGGGIVMMGVRLYQPQMGRFLQVDPVLGGTANPYEYPSDPVNGADLDGRMKIKRQVFSRATAKKILKFLRKLDSIQHAANGIIAGGACELAAGAVGIPTAGSGFVFVTAVCGTVALIAGAKLPTFLHGQIRGLRKALITSGKRGTGKVSVRFGVTHRSGLLLMPLRAKFWAHWYPQYPQPGGGGAGGGW